MAVSDWQQRGAVLVAAVVTVGVAVGGCGAEEDAGPAIGAVSPPPPDLELVGPATPPASPKRADDMDLDDAEQWSGDFQVAGTFTGSEQWSSDGLGEPRTGRNSYQTHPAEVARVSFEVTTDERHSLGMSLIGPPDGSVVRRISFRAPHPESDPQAGRYRILQMGLQFAVPLRWLELPVGERDSTVDLRRKRFVISVTRTAETTWEFDLVARADEDIPANAGSAHRDMERAEDHLDRIFVRLDTDAAEPPWDEFRIQVYVVGRNGDEAAADLAFTRMR